MKNLFLLIDIRVHLIFALFCLHNLNVYNIMYSALCTHTRVHI